MNRFFAIILLLSSDYLATSFLSTFRSPTRQLFRKLTHLFANNQNGNMGFKRTAGNMGNMGNVGIPQKITPPQEYKKDAGDALRTEARRRKVGPPNRGGNGKISREENLAAGRVSVYCIGAGLDLQALRAHVFRRGFGNQNVDVGSVHEGEEIKAGLVLARDRPGDEDLGVDDEVLHVSNAPLFIAAEKSNRVRGGDGEEWFVSQNNNGNSGTQGPGSNAPEFGSSSTSVNEELNVIKEYEFSRSVTVKEDEDDISDDEWKTREILLMATQDIFYFGYGCVVFWGLSTREEKAAMAELAAFTVDPVSSQQLDTSYDTLEYVFDRKANPQRPIRFDRMRLRSLQLAEKLALSYAMAQSSKLFVFESNVLDSVERTRYLPKELAMSGRIDSSKKALNQRIGELFVEQTEVNLFSSILDTPDFLWDDDEHLPAYQYTRAYLEVDDRVALLNSRLAVIRDLLDVLTAQVADSNSTRLEWIIIWLISVEIIMGIASNPLFAGRRVLASSLVPLFIFGYKRINWNNILKSGRK